MEHSELAEMIKELFADEEKLKQTPLEEQGYRDVQDVPNHGTCGVRRLLFTWGVFCNIDETGFAPYRFCYSSLIDALEAINTWDGEEFPPGPWIVMKGIHGDVKNPKGDIYGI